MRITSVQEVGGICKTVIDDVQGAIDSITPEIKLQCSSFVPNDEAYALKNDTDTIIIANAKTCRAIRKCARSEGWIVVRP